MSSTAIATVIRMMETLPETTQNQVVEHLSDYIAELRDEIRWDVSFKTTQGQLAMLAQRARQEIGEGRAEPMDYDRL